MITVLTDPTHTAFIIHKQNFDAPSCRFVHQEVEYIISANLLTIAIQSGKIKLDHCSRKILENNLRMIHHRTMPASIYYLLKINSITILSEEFCSIADDKDTRGIPYHIKGFEILGVKELKKPMYSFNWGDF